LAEDLRPRDWEGKPVDRSLVDDLANVLACQAAGWLGILKEINVIDFVTEDGFGVHAEVKRVMARYRASKEAPDA